MKRTGTWLIVVAWWLYFIAAVVLYHRGFAWANTVDVLAGFVLLLVVSTGYVDDRIRSRRGQTPLARRWGVGLWGVYRRRNGPGASYTK